MAPGHLISAMWCQSRAKPTGKPTGLSYQFTTPRPQQPTTVLLGEPAAPESCRVTETGASRAHAHGHRRCRKTRTGKWKPWKNATTSKYMEELVAISRTLNHGWHTTVSQKKQPSTPQNGTEIVQLDPYRFRFSLTSAALSASRPKTKQGKHFSYTSQKAGRKTL